MTIPYKLRIKVGQSEFDAEGPEEAVREQFEQFLEVLTVLGGRAPAAPTPPTPESVGPPQSEDKPPAAAIEPALLERAFVDHPKNGVSLRVLPRSDDQAGDALVMI